VLGCFCMALEAAAAITGLSAQSCMAECRKLGDVPGSACAIYRFARPMPTSKCFVHFPLPSAQPDGLR
jgi:hypothetical protein